MRGARLVEAVEGRQIRKVFHEGQWWFSIIDVVAALVGGDQPRKYWSDLKQKLITEGYFEVSEKIGQLKMAAPDGKRRGGGNYFEELLARIRDIRSSEKVFWRKVLDIYATSIDYDPSAEASQAFFATVQNKMHWAAHGHTAAEVVHARADAAKQNMGMTNWVGSKPTRDEAIIAKNYLAPSELDALNRIVMAYLEFAELQAVLISSASAHYPLHICDGIPAACAVNRFKRGEGVSGRRSEGLPLHALVTCVTLQPRT